MDEQALSRLISALPEILRCLQAAGCIDATLHLDASGKLEIRPGARQASTQPARTPRTDTPLEGEQRLLALRIVEAIVQADKPVKARTLAHRCGKNWNSYFRSLLARLVQDGILSNQGSGYSLGTKKIY